MILLAMVLGWVSGVAVNGLADNLVREDAVPLRAAAIPRCRYCDAPRKFPDWSAILSTIFHSGRCLRCGAPRPLRDLLVEALLWLGFPAVWIIIRGDIHGLLTGGFILAVAVLFSTIDFEHRIVAVEVVALVSLALLLDGWTHGTATLIRLLLGGAAGFGIFLVLFLLGKVLAVVFRLGRDTEPLGFGDVILAALVGFVTGWPAILLAIFVSIFAGGIAGLILAFLTAIHRSPWRNATMAYGPYLLLAGLLVYFFGTPFLGGILNILAGF
jgi:leader peptidase (prepilin peptidase)/N-methyltransferase